MSDHIQIMPFEPKHQPGVDAMLESIVPEYAESFFHQPLKKMDELYLLPGRHYWVALEMERVAGTVGTMLCSDYAILKSLFVAKEFRGAGRQVSTRLLHTAEDKARQCSCSTMYLGTMEQFKAALRFYEKHGYEPVDREALPEDFPHNALDVLFFKKTL